MNERRIQLYSFPITLLMCFMCAAAQTTWWYRFFGTLTAPSIWIPCIIYFAIYRTKREGLLLTVCSTLLISSFTISPSGLILATSLVIYFGAQYMKKMVIWRGLSYFAMMTAGATAAFPLIQRWFASMFQAHAPGGFGILSWIVTVLTTFIICPLIYFLLHKMDHFFGRDELLTERTES